MNLDSYEGKDRLVVMDACGLEEGGGSLMAKVGFFFSGVYEIVGSQRELRWLSRET